MFSILILWYWLLSNYVQYQNVWVTFLSSLHQYECVLPIWTCVIGATLVFLVHGNFTWHYTMFLSIFWKDALIKNVCRFITKHSNEKYNRDVIKTNLTKFDDDSCSMRSWYFKRIESRTFQCLLELCLSWMP